jgi:hypothetical protein
MAARTAELNDEAQETETENVQTVGSAADCPRHVREHYDAIRGKEQVVRQLERAFLDAKRQAKNAKEDFDAADLELRNLIADGLDPQTRLPFPAEPQVEEDADAWRLAPLDQLFLPEKLHEKLVAVGVETIGDLEDLRAEISQGQADWPKGFGVAKVTAVENAVLAWLSDHRDHWGEPVETAGAAAGV